MAIDFNEKIYILDGAIGTMLQRAGMKPGESSTRFSLQNPDIMKRIYTEYMRAGSDIIYAATFGINKFKIDEIGTSVKDAMAETMRVACDARDEFIRESERKIKVAIDIGPLGEMLEPMGVITFEKAYDAFAQIVNEGKKYGADLVVIETMTDLYEVKAAVLAAKENTDLPVAVSMTFEENERTFTGVSLQTMALTLEGLGVDAMGINCSLGPAEILPLVIKLKEFTSVPVFAKPNAGLPDPVTGEYGIGSEQFADIMREYMKHGISMIGGCCGTTPEYIARLTEYREEFKGSISKASGNGRRNMAVCSSTDVVTANHITVIGERLNPTGKKRLKRALIEEDYDYIMSQAIEQIDGGAEILDVNVGVPSLDDASVLPKVIKKLQSVTSVPLQIDSSNPVAIEAALRVYNGKAIVNSVNGEPDVMDGIFPAVKKYGAAVIGLTLDGCGIPETAEERFAIAERIFKKALEYGIPKEDVIIDCLTLTASAQQKEVNETLRAVKMVKERLGLKTTLGVSNISFGLPMRNLINRTFLAMALECGLDLPIINPNDEDMMSVIYAYNVLKNADKNAGEFIGRYGQCEVKLPEVIKRNADDVINSSDENTAKESVRHDVFHAISNGMKIDTVSAVKELLKSHNEMEVVNGFLIPALDNVGKGFEKGSVFLPQMLQAATAAQAGFNVIKDRLAESDKESVSLGDIVFATVKGDIHDIGKNIVKVIMENYGYRIIDLGRDVPAVQVVEAVKKGGIRLVGLSALMTTTLGSMEETVRAVKAAAPDCKIMVGGAVLTEEYARKIGADYYCKDAMKSVEAAQEVFG